MKTLLFLLPALFGVFAGMAQENSSGTVKYEQVVKLEIKLEGDAAQFAGLLPKERKTEKLLYFNPSASLYENSKSADEDITMQSGGGNVMIHMAEPDNKVFTDLSSGKQLEQREFMTRIFLIEGKMQNQWKITGNQKMILDYPCQEAVSEVGEKKVSVWFTPVIPVSAGPGKYGGLPGLILAVETDEGKMTTTAVSVDFTPVGEDIVSEPQKGKNVTQEEFDKVVEEKMKEMGAEGGAGGRQMMIRIQR